MSEVYLVLEKVALWLGGFGLLALVWKASATFTKLESAVEEIKENHIPHIYDELRHVREEIREGLRGRD